MRYLLTFSITLGSAFGLQLLALKSVGGRTAKSESNFFSSLGRIQAGAQGTPEVMVLGSSITGRLPDRSRGYTGWANMGCDGGSAVDVLRAMDESSLPTAPHLVIEANTLQMALNAKTPEIGTSIRRPWFRVGLHLPCLAAYARPAAFFYSKLLAKRIGDFDSHRLHEDLGVSSKPELVTTPPASQFSAAQESLINEVTAILHGLQQKGTVATIVWLPPARGNGSEPPAWILELARRSGVRYWDLGQQANSDEIILTDGVHMAAPSAAKTMESLRKVLE
ncbi:MAG: hypothetical protein H7Y36_11845 [Armatimonadetes bacterium]|nr:hypothetical protein [Akkermansiaceae bacterium]